MKWKRNQRVGFCVRNFDELERTAILGANMAEIKLEKFANSGASIYFFKNGEFIINDVVVDEIAQFAKKHNVKIQFHLPIEMIIDSKVENGLNAAVVNHHDIIIKRFIMFEKLYQKYNIGQILTVHPPLVSLDGVELIAQKQAIKNAKILFDRLDKVRMNKNHDTVIGMENQTDIKKKAGNLGYLPIHFRRILKDTRTIGITIDTGHRRLAKEFSIREFLQLGLTVNNFHFHGNEGIFNPYDWSDDQHLLPDRDNVTGYQNYLRYFRRHRAPIVLEISHLNNYSDEELYNFLIRFKQELI